MGDGRSSLERHAVRDLTGHRKPQAVDVTDSHGDLGLHATMATSA